MIFLISFCSVVFPQTSFTIPFASRCEVEIVLTAHPTQINRGTLQYKHIRLSHLLNLRDRPDLTSEDRDMVIEDLVREITSVWQTDELRHHKPTPSDEARAGLNIVEQSLWKAVPHYLRCVSDALKKVSYWKTTSIEMHTNQVTKDVSLLSRWMTIDLYIREVDSLKFELSMNRCSDILSKLAQEILEHKSASEDHQSWDHQCYNRNQVKQQAAALPTQLPARADQPSCTAEFGRHAETLDAITKYFDMGTYSEWDEEKKLEFLTRELKGKRPLVPPSMEVASDVKEVLDTFRISAELGSDWLGAYEVMSLLWSFCKKMHDLPLVER
ncbi:hypothetical protein ABKV19_004997 [Rosa sericea]